MSLPEYLQVPEIAARYRKVKPYFALRTSSYDVSAECQLRCQDCSYFSSSMSEVAGVLDPDLWRELMLREKERGINFVNLGGAEPSLVPSVLRACHGVIPQGVVITNGLRRLPEELDSYAIHISIWGTDQADAAFRPYLSGKPGIAHLNTALKNYASDSRVRFVYTFNAHNTADVDEVAARVVGAGHKLTFNVFTTPDRANSPLRIGSVLAPTRDKMIELLDRYPGAVLYSYYNAEVHTHDKGLNDLFGCVFPRAKQLAGQVAGAVGHTYRSYRADLTHAGAESCCAPGQSCRDCRLYAAGTIIVPANMQWHARSEQHFRAWLDYVDTFLSVYIPTYSSGPPLSKTLGLLSGPVPGPLRPVTAEPRA